MHKDTGQFRELAPGEPLASRESGPFIIGQEVVVNGQKLRIRKITKKDIILRPIRQQENEND